MSSTETGYTMCDTLMMEYSTSTEVNPNIGLLKVQLGAEDMAQSVERLAAKPDDLSSTPRPHVVERKTDLCKFFYDHHMCAMACTYIIFFKVF